MEYIKKNNKCEWKLITLDYDSKYDLVRLEIYGYVQDWLKCNPSEQFMSVGRRTIAEILVRLFEKAKIKKPSNPHALRHAAITHCVNIGMQQNAIGQRFWGNVSTNMLKTYISLSEQMQASAYKNAKGMGEGNEDELY